MPQRHFALTTRSQPPQPAIHRTSNQTGQLFPKTTSRSVLSPRRAPTGDRGSLPLKPFPLWLCVDWSKVLSQSCKGCKPSAPQRHNSTVSRVWLPHRPLHTIFGGRDSLLRPALHVPPSTVTQNLAKLANSSGPSAASIDTKWSPDIDSVRTACHKLAETISFEAPFHAKQAYFSASIRNNTTNPKTS